MKKWTVMHGCAIKLLKTIQWLLEFKSVLTKNILTFVNTS